MTAIQSPTIEEQAQAKTLLQDAQTTIVRWQMRYSDTTPEFWGLRVAWEALRFAWYVADRDPQSAADKLHLLKDAIADYEERQAAPKGD